MPRKLRAGFFSLTGCEGEMIVFLELLNDRFPEWSGLLDIRAIRLLREAGDSRDLDVAFVEGAVSTEKELDELRRIRKNCRRLVAMGSCAATGGPSAQRNLFDERKSAEIESLVKKLRQLKKVLAVPEVVKADHIIPGCPITEDGFTEVLEKLMKEFGITGYRGRG